MILKIFNMIKYIFCALLLLLASVSKAQNIFEKELDSVQDEAQAAKFIETHTSNKGQLYVFNKEKHKTQLAQELFAMGKGASKTIVTNGDKTHYKIIEKYHRYSYVYLDGRDKSLSEMKQLQQSIISKYEDGFRFKDLAKRYSMDGNANRGGDLGWFTKGKNSTELQDAIIDDNNGADIFTLDFPDKQAFYVVIRTYPTKFIEEIKVLQVTESTR